VGKGISRFLQGQKYFILTRFIRFFYGFFVIYVFADSNSYKIYFSLEPIIPILAALLLSNAEVISWLYRNYLLAFLLGAIAYFFSGDVFFGLLTMLIFNESLIYVVSFSVKRDVNIRNEFIYAIVVTAGLVFSYFFAFSFVVFFLIVLFGSYLKFLFYKKVLVSFELDLYAKKARISIVRLLYQVFFRFYMGNEALVFWSMIFIRLINQFSLFLWSYIKSVDGRNVMGDRFAFLFCRKYFLFYFFSSFSLAALSICFDRASVFTFLFFGLSVLLFLFSEYVFLNKKAG